MIYIESDTGYFAFKFFCISVTFSHDALLEDIIPHFEVSVKLREVQIR